MAFDAAKPAYQGPVVSQDLRNNFNALKGQIDTEHNADGTHKDAIKKTGDTSTGDQAIKKSTPALRLIGTEVSAKDVRIVESAGYIIMQKNVGSEGSPSWTDVFKLNTADFLLTVAKIDQNNFTATTAIPDSKLATISTAGKVADTALSSNITKNNTANVFTNNQTVQGAGKYVELDDTGDATYKGRVSKSADGKINLQIINKSGGAVAAYLTLSATEVYSDKSIRTANQLKSDVATGTPPLVVQSATKVANLYADRAATVDNFGQSLVSNGWQKLPGGLIIQWGYLASRPSVVSTHNFTTPFLTACFGVFFTEVYGAQHNDNIKLNNSPSLNAFTIHGDAPSIPVYWWAVGC